VEALKARNTVTQKTTVIVLRSTSFPAFSAKKISNAPTWADGPGYYISRLWR
jgi:hypothetical protein